MMNQDISMGAMNVNHVDNWSDSYFESVNEMNVSWENGTR